MESWTLGAVGDVFVNRRDPASAFAHAEKVLNACDLVFGNCEGAFTSTSVRAPSSGWRVVAPEIQAVALSSAGFDVMSCANNHTLDAGHEGLADTLSELRRQGIGTAGAGMDFSEAHRPAILECNGVKVAVLAYSSVYQAGYESRGNVPGLAAMRIHSTPYFPDWDAYGKVEPGHTPTVRTTPYPEDMDKLRSQIAQARKLADVVVTSFHWGRASQPAIMTDYERIVGKAAIDAGADVVLGHHHHYLRGIEIYQGKPIYYGLGHFVFDLAGMETALSASDIENLKAMGEHTIYPRDGFPLSPFHPDARMTMVAVCRFDGAFLVAAEWIPCLINGENHAVPLKIDGPEGQRILRYMTDITRQVGINTTYEPSGRHVGEFGTFVAR